MQVALASRKLEKLQPLVDEIKARAFYCDASEPNEVAKLFEQVSGEMGVPNLVLFNAGMRARGHWRDGERERLRRIRAVCDDQVQFARTRAKHGARTGAERHSCCPCRHRRRNFVELRDRRCG